jgi:predicted permease
MNTLLNDFRYALRGFRRTPLFTTIAVLSLAFGIGANTAIFSLLDQVLLRLLPVKHPEQLVLFNIPAGAYGSNWGMNAISYPMYKDFKDNNQVFSGMFCRFPIPASLGYGNRTERISAELVSGSYFPELGVGAAIGRVLTPDEDKTPGGQPLTVLSYSFWRNRFSSDAAIVGKTVVINGRNMTVIGVAQPGFDGVELGQSTKAFIPIMMKAQLTPNWDGLKDRRQRWVNVFGRLKPGISRKKAEASLQPFMHSILAMEVKEEAFRNVSAYDRAQFLKSRLELLPGSQGRSYLRRDLSTPLLVLIALTGAVLLLACANLANLLLARATTREREFAIRLAIGAGRSRVISQLLVESVLLSAFGAVLGLALAFWVDNYLLRVYLPAESTGDIAISATPDLRVLAFTFWTMLLTALVFGLVPALQSSRADVAPTLKDQAGAVLGGSNVLLRKILVAAQVTLSLLLLIGAGLFTRTLSNLRNLGPGFAADRLIGFELDPTLSGYSVDRTKTFYKRLTEELQALPGTTSVGLASLRILDGNDWESSMTIEGYATKQGEHPEPYMNSVGPNYFATLNIPIVTGRDFTVKDVRELKHGPKEDDWEPSVIIINESFAKKYFKDRNPVGLHLGFGSNPGTKADMEIIGVVKDVKYTNLRDEIPVQAFIPYLGSRFAGGMTVYLRTSLDPNQLMGHVRRRVQALDANIPVYGMRTLEEQISISLRNERLVASLSSIFGLLATVLAVIGLYGVMAYTVARRTREIGIRMALGALQGNVLWMVMKEVAILIGAGVLVGVPVALALTRLVQNQLYGLAPHDPITLIFATLILAVVAGLAGFIPALRASRIDPTQALRYE